MKPIETTNQHEPQFEKLQSDKAERSDRSKRDRRLFRRYQRTGDTQYRDQIFSEHLGLVAYLVRPYRNKGVDYEDLYQEGCMGLLRAIEGFDLSMNVEFTTFARPFIIGHVKEYFRDKAWPCSVPRSIKGYSLQIHRLARITGDTPTYEEIKASGLVPPNKIAEAQQAGRVWHPVTFHSNQAAGGINPAVLRVSAARDALLESADDRVMIEEAMRTKLTPDEARIIRLYYKEGLSQRQIAESVGSYQMKVSRQLQGCLCKLEEAIPKSA